MGKDKIEMTVVTTTALESSDTILPASPDIVKRGRTFPFLLRETASWRAWRDTARADLKSMRWLRAVMWTAIVFWVYVLVMVVTSLATMAIQSPDSGFRIPDFIDHFLGVFGLQLVSRSFSNYNACQPNGGFSIVPNSYRWWSMGDFFEITIGFSSLSFTQAKLLDILWGIAFGRLAQALAGYVSWRVFADYLTTSMATTPATYTTFWVVFLHREPSLAAWLRLLREFWRGGVLKSKVAMSFMALTMVFVIAIPTLTNSMTGYTPASRAFIKITEAKEGEARQQAMRFGYTDSLVRFANFKETLYIIHDGSRVGLTDHYPIPTTPQTAGEPMLWEQHDFAPQECGMPCSPGTYDAGQCIFADISNYVQTYGFYGLANVSSTFQDKNLAPPALNISAGYIPPTDMFLRGYGRSLAENTTLPNNCWGREWIDPRTGHEPFSDSQHRMYQDMQNRTYPLEYLLRQGTCRPDTEDCPETLDGSCTIQKYSWGFSYIQIFLNAILYLIWTVGLYIMWIKSQVQFPLKGAPEIPRGWRALIHLGETIRKDLDRRGIDPERLTDRQLKTEIRKQLRGGSVQFEEHLADPGLGLWRAFKAWYRQGKNRRFLRWYAGITLAAVVINIISGSREINGWFGFAVMILGLILSFGSVGMVWAMALGRTTTGKTLFILIWSLVVPGVGYGLRIAIGS